MREDMRRRREVTTLAFENAGREISQVFDVMNSNLALAAGTLAALLAVLGAGELFAQAKEGTQVRGGSFPRLSAVSLIVLAAAAPLVMRFFVRSMTAYQNLLRFLDIQRTSWAYLSGQRSWSYFEHHYEIFWMKWRTPKSMRRVVWENVKYGFMWIGVVMLGAIGYAFWSVDSISARLVAGSILLLGIGWELITLVGYRKRYYQVPTDDEHARLEDLKCEPSEGAEGEGSVGPAEDAVLEHATGMFLGTRRLLKRRD